MKLEKSIDGLQSHMPFIDGCRGIAILIVVLGHGGLGHIIPGKFGVTLFFFISGYLITRLLLVEIEKTGNINLAHFYLRRFFRLYPGLLAMIGFSILLGLVMQATVPRNDILSSLFYFTNYYIGWIRPVVADPYRLLDIIWSLSVEEHFYFFFPFMTVLFLGPGKCRSESVFLNILVLLSLTAFIFRCYLFFLSGASQESIEGRIYFSTHTRMDSILWGCIAAFLVLKKEGSRIFLFILSPRGFYTGLLLLFLSVAIRYYPFRQTLLFSFQGVGLLLLIPALHYPAFIKFRKIAESPLLIYVGKISYSLYLFHWGASKLANSMYPEYTLRWEILYWGITIPLALGSYYLIEKPFMKLRRKFGSTAFS